MKYGEGFAPPIPDGEGGELLELWETYSEEDRYYLLEKAFIRKVLKGETIYKAGDMPKHCFLLMSGRVKVVREGIPGGRPHIIQILKPAVLFGYRSYFGRTPNLTSAVALQDCELVCYPFERFTEMMVRYRAFGRFIIKHIVRDLGLADLRNITLTQKCVRGRLAEALLYVQDACGEQADGTLDVQLSREDLANLSNMTTSNAIRTLSAFAKEGLVELRGKQIIIVAKSELEEISRRG